RGRAQRHGSAGRCDGARRAREVAPRRREARSDHVPGPRVPAQLGSLSRRAPPNRLTRAMTDAPSEFDAGAALSEMLAFLTVGRMFTTRHVAASQDGKPVLDLSCSFTADTDGYVYDLPGGHDIPSPDEVELEQGPGPWVAGDVGPTPPRADGTRESTHRMWFRV